MRYDQNDRESSNVEDRRGEGGGGFRFPGGGIQIPIGGGGMSLTTLLIIGAVMLLLGINPLDVLFGTGGQINMPDLPRTERPVTRDRIAQQHPRSSRVAAKSGGRRRSREGIHQQSAG